MLFKVLKSGRTSAFSGALRGGFCKGRSEAIEGAAQRYVASVPTSTADNVDTQIWHNNHSLFPSIIGRELLIPTCAKAVLENRAKNGRNLDSLLWSPEFAQQNLGPSIERVPVDIQLNAHQAAQQLMDPDVEVEPLSEPEPLSSELGPTVMVMATKRPYQPSVLVRKRRHGFLARLKTVGGRRILSRRRSKGRAKLTA